MPLGRPAAHPGARGSLQRAQPRAGNPRPSRAARQGLRELGPRRSPSAAGEKSTFPFRSRPLTCGDPAGQQRPEAEEDAGLARPAARGHLAPDPRSGNAGSGRCAPRAPAPGAERSSRVPRRRPRGCPGSAAAAGGEGAPPCPQRARRAENSSGAGASRLPSRREPDFLHLGREEGFMQRARRAVRGQGWGRNAKLGPPRGHSARDSRRLEWRGHWAGRALQLPQDAPRPEQRGEPAARLRDAGRLGRARPAAPGLSSVSPGPGRAPAPPSLPVATLCRTERDLRARSSRGTPVLVSSS